MWSIPKTWLLIGLPGALFVHEAAVAQDEKPEPNVLVVTATRRATTEGDAPAMMDVITEKTIARLPAENVTHVVEREAGIETSMPQGQGIVTPQMVTLRGMRDSGRTLLLVDGQPWNGSFTDYFYFSYIPFEAVRRVEVVRGPFSSLYGTNAMAGVMQFFTHDGFGEPAHVGLRAAAGDFGRTSASVTGSAGSETVSAFVSAHTYSAGNYYLNERNYDTTNRGVELSRVHGHVKARPSEDLELHFTGGHFVSLTGHGVSGLPTVENVMNDARSYANLFGTWSASPGVALRFGLDHIAEKSTYFGATNVSATATPDYYESRNISGYARTRLAVGSDIELSPDNTLTFGGEFNALSGHKKIVDATTGDLLDVLGEPGEAVDVSENNWSAYVQDDMRLADGRLQLVLGARFDSYEEYGDEISPKVAANWHMGSDARIKASAGRAFRAPTLNHRYTPDWLMRGAATQAVPFPPFSITIPGMTYTANPDLRAESLWSYDLGLEKDAPQHGLKSRVAAFYTDAKDFIEHVEEPHPTLADQIYLQPQNIQTVRIYGIETKLQWEPMRDLAVFANYQWSRTIDVNSGDMLHGYPASIANAGATWTRWSFDRSHETAVTLAARKEGPRTWSWGNQTGEIDGWLRLDLRVSHSLMGGRVTFFADVFNLLDTEAESCSATDWLPERNFMAGVQARYEF